jgi:acyl carrier protein
MPVDAQVKEDAAAPLALRRDPPPPLWELEERVITVACNHLQIRRDEVMPNSRIVEDLGCDSLDFVELIMAIEEEFAVTLSDEEAPKVFTSSATVGMIAGWVIQRWNCPPEDRKQWKRAPVLLPQADAVPFTQYGPDPMRNSHWTSPLYRTMEPNREGFRQVQRLTDGMRCVLIPEAEVWIGCDGPSMAQDQRPVHRVHLNAFIIDAEPVSCVAYARFLNTVGPVEASILEEWCAVEAKDHRRDQFPLRKTRKGWFPVPGMDEQPMILVSWLGVNAYALWAHQQDWKAYRTDTPCFLPTEAQWEYAARGPEAASHPYNGQNQEDPSCRMGVTGKHRAGTDYTASTFPAARVCERRGMSPFGLHHMGGNVWQWCRDCYDPNFYSQADAGGVNPVSRQPTGIRSERGGSWVGPEILASPTYRRGRPPAMKGRCLGFRCVGVVSDAF